ncbi:MAG: type II toxin-antitoxin system VapC family toxin [Pseudonocardiaceae bacterium]
MIVVDASAVLELLLRTPAGVQVENVLARGDAAAPDLVDAEVFSGLIRARKSGRLSEDELAGRVELLRDVDVERHPTGDLLTTARSCAAALSGYAALYAALATVLATVLRCPVLTSDSRFAATAVDQLGISTICIPTSGTRAP